MTGLQADIISANRKLLEDIQYRVKKLEMGLLDPEQNHLAVDSLIDYHRGVRHCSDIFPSRRRLYRKIGSGDEEKSAVYPSFAGERRRLHFENDGRANEKGIVDVCGKRAF